VRDIFGVEPDDWQIEFLENVRDHKRTAVASGHGIGKTAATSWVISWFLLTRPGSRIIATSNTATQLKTRLWAELVMWGRESLLKDALIATKTRLMVVGGDDDWFAEAVPWNEAQPEAFQGLHGDVLMVFDEASAIATNIFEAAYGSLTTPESRIAMLGNPTRTDGEFHKAFHDHKHLWATQQVDSRTAKMADKELAAEWIQTYGDDSDFVRVKVKGQFPRAGSSNLISPQLVDEAFERIPVKNDAVKVAGVDVARFGDDNTVYFLRQGNIHLRTEVRGKLDNVEVVDFVIEMVIEDGVDVVIIDCTGGHGNGIHDMLKRKLQQKGICEVVEYNSSYAAEDDSFTNARVECYYKGKEWLRDGYLLKHKEIKEDLTNIDYFYEKKTNRKILEGKDAIKIKLGRSPDYGDAWAMTFFGGYSKKNPNRKNTIVQNVHERTGKFVG
jgi:hypothetical protein